MKGTFLGMVLVEKVQASSLEFGFLDRYIPQGYFCMFDSSLESLQPLQLNWSHQNEINSTVSQPEPAQVQDIKKRPKKLLK